MILSHPLCYFGQTIQHQTDPSPYIPNGVDSILKECQSLKQSLES
jgi:hypothetical protein